METRRCKKCNEDRPVVQFYTGKNGNIPYTRSECITCWTRRCENNRLIRDYGITLDQYQQIVESQGGCCAICKSKHANARGYKLYVDHDHTTGVARGVICYKCNTILGMAGDSKEILRAAIEYLGN